MTTMVKPLGGKPGHSSEPVARVSEWDHLGVLHQGQSNTNRSIIGRIYERNPFNVIEYKLTCITGGDHIQNDGYLCDTN